MSHLELALVFFPQGWARFSCLKFIFTQIWFQPFPLSFHPLPRSSSPLFSLPYQVLTLASFMALILSLVLLIPSLVKHRPPFWGPPPTPSWEVPPPFEIMVKGIL